MAPASSRLEFGILGTPTRRTYRSINAATNSGGTAAMKAIIQKRRFRVTVIAMVSDPRSYHETVGVLRCRWVVGRNNAMLNVSNTQRTNADFGNADPKFSDDSVDAYRPAFRLFESTPVYSV